MIISQVRSKGPRSRHQRQKRAFGGQAPLDTYASAALAMRCEFAGCSGVWPSFGSWPPCALALSALISDPEVMRNDNPYLTNDGFPKALTRRQLNRIRLGNLWDTISVLFGMGDCSETLPDGSRIYRHPTGHENYSGGTGSGR
jgi:hypothetical protein